MTKILPQLIDNIAQTSPNKVAFRFKTEAITYGDLCKQTDNLAYILQAQGVKQGDLKDNALVITMAKEADHAVSIKHDAPFHLDFQVKLQKFRQ